jgi:hypothetical protein
LLLFSHFIDGNIKTVPTWGLAPDCIGDQCGSQDKKKT